MRIITLVLAAGLLGCAALIAQTDRGAIRGTILDPSGAGVPGARVHADNDGTKIRTTVLSLGEGGYTFSSLAPGAYVLSVEAAGFKKSVAGNVVVHIGDMMQVHLPLSIAHPACTMLEYIPWIRECFVEPATVRDGFFVPPEQPGVGTTLRDDALTRFGVR